MSHLLFSLLHTARVLEQSPAHALGDAGLSPVEFDVLTELASAGEPVPEGALESVAVVARLETLGLVRREGNCVAITPLGRERRRAGAERLTEVQRQLAEALAGIDRDSLARALAVLRGGALEPAEA